MSTNEKVTAATYKAAGQRLASAEKSKQQAEVAAQDGLLTAARKEHDALKLAQHSDRVALVVAAWIKAAKVKDTAQNRASRKLLLETAPFIPRVKSAVKDLEGHRMRNIRTGLTICRKAQKDGKKVPNATELHAMLAKSSTGNGGGNKSGLTGLRKDGEWSKHFGKAPKGSRREAAFAFDKLAMLASICQDEDTRNALTSAMNALTSVSWDTAEIKDLEPVA